VSFFYKMKNKITVSIVSHGNIVEVSKLLKSILYVDTHFIHKLIITINIPEDLSILNKIRLPFKRELIINSKKKGFGENHNNAFKYCQTEFFLVLNPDVIFPKNFNFYDLIKNINVINSSLITPKIKTNNKIIYPQKFPSLLNYIFLKKDYFTNKDILVDWISGCFMFFRATSYSNINGFDQKFFLYMEDVDICKKLRLANKTVALDNNQFIYHNARRLSKKKFRYFLYHVSAILKYFIKYSNIH
jgi:N-acetylglucosaminyl-diphospho-decaprenol L-rhamnosyltransferase